MDRTKPSPRQRRARRRSTPAVHVRAEHARRVAV